MREYLRSRNAAYFVAGGFIAALFLGGAAHAITDTVFKYSTPQTGYAVVPPAAFVPDRSGATYFSGLSLSVQGTGSQCFFAPVNLPQDAKMTTLDFWYERTASDSFAVLLYRRDQESGTNLLVMNKTPRDSGGAYKSASYAITDTTVQRVNNKRYAYLLDVCLSVPTDSFGGARVTYTYTDAGD